MNYKLGKLHSRNAPSGGVCHILMTFFQMEKMSNYIHLLIQLRGPIIEHYLAHRKTVEELISCTVECVHPEARVNVF